MNVRTRLRELRKLLDLSGGDLAEAARMTRQAYSMLESGRMAARAVRMAEINNLLRRTRDNRVVELRADIERLLSFRIDETLYFTQKEILGERERG